MCIFNVAEINTIIVGKSRIENLLTVYDTASDSSYISSDLASKLGCHNKKKVILHLQTIPGEQDFETFQYNMKLQVGDSYKEIIVYECPTLGYLNQVPGLNAMVEEAVEAKVKIPSGPVDILLGLKHFSVHPTAVPTSFNLKIPFQEVRLLKSETTGALLIGGAIPRTFIRELHCTPKVGFAFFTTSELAAILLKERDLDVIPLQCDTCQERTRDCLRCKMARKPISLQNQRERKMIKDALRFDAKKGVIETAYYPTESTFNDIFPPSLSNEKEATAISRKVFKRLKASGQLKAFQEAFQKYLDLGYMRILSKKEMEEWEKKNLCINYCSIHGVPKDVSDPTKQAMRVVLNSSLRRKCFLRGKLTTSSLNAVLPVGKSDITSLVDILLQWSTKEYSLIYDLVKAYNNIIAGGDEESQKMLHLRRFIWYQGEEGNEREITATCTTVWYGDSCASSILEEVKTKVSEDLEERGEIEASKTTLNSYIDDTAKSFDTKKEAFKIFEQCKNAMATYNIQIHSPTISSSQGKFDTESSDPRKVPSADEPERIKFFGLEYSPFDDTITIRIQKKLNTKGHRGLREMPDLTVERLQTEEITMRKFCSWTHSVWDPTDKMTPVTCQGKLVLAHIQAAFPPTSAENWDKKLEGELEKEAKGYMEMIIRMDDFTYSRSPPRGVLTELHIHHDAGEELVATGVWGIYEDQDNKSSKHLYSKSHIGKRTIPDLELSSAFAASSLALNMLPILPSVQRVRCFGDSTSTQTQLCSVNKAKDVFSKNRISKTISNVKSIQEQGVNISFNLVPSQYNAIDKATKKHEDADKYIYSSSWLKGPSWANKSEEEWPVSQVVELKNDLFEMTDAMSSNNDDEDTAEKVQVENTFTTKIKEGEEKSSIFTGLLKRVSVARVAIRAVARVSRIFKAKSFSGAKRSPSAEDESKAWLLLARDQQRLMTIKDENLLPFEEEGCVFTRQRWSKDTHRMMFNCDQLPILTASSALGQLLLQAAHRDPGGPCRSDLHAAAHLKSSSSPAFITGNVASSLCQIRKGCVSCRKKGMAIKGNMDSVFSPKMSADNYKQAAASPWSRISVDLIAPVKTFDRPERTSRARPTPRYAKKAILVVADCSGVAAVRYVLMSDQSAAAFCAALQQHITLSGRTPEIIYSDMGTIFTSMSKKEREKAQQKDEVQEAVLAEGDGAKAIDYDEVKRRVCKIYPTIEFHTATSGSQSKNAISEEKVKYFKLFVKNILSLKPNASIPAINNEHLNLILTLAAYHINCRPIGFIKPNQYLCANHFVLPNFDAQQWTADESIAAKYSHHQEYMSKMHEEYLRLMQSGKYLPTKWKVEGLLPKEGDIIFVSRGQNKVNKLGCLEYARIISISEDKRLVSAIVCRSKSGELKEISVDSRNCKLVYRPSESEST